MSHHSFIEYVAGKGKPFLVSTGVCELLEVRESVELLEGDGVDDLVLLLRVAAYLIPLSQINVRVVEPLREEFRTSTGLSDHILEPVTAPSTAVVLDASVIQKHVTLDTTMEGPDHQFALEPNELESMFDEIRKTETALVVGLNEVLDAEEERHDIARRCIHATRNISTGEHLKGENVAILKSGEAKAGSEPEILRPDT